MILIYILAGVCSRSFSSGYLPRAIYKICRLDYKRGQSKNVLELPGLENKL